MTDHSTPVARLRLVLRANAAFSLACGTVALIAASWLSHEMGIDHVALTRLLGVGLIGFAAAVGMISRLEEPRLRSEAALVSIADTTWVLGSVALLFTGWLNATGNVVLTLVGLVVADFGATQLWYRSKATPRPPDIRTATA